MEMSMDRDWGMWSGMNRSDGAYDKVIHGKSMLSTALPKDLRRRSPKPSVRSKPPPL